MLAGETDFIECIKFCEGNSVSDFCVNVRGDVPSMIERVNEKVFTGRI